MNNLIKKENNSFYSKELSIFEVDNQNDIGIIENTSILKNKENENGKIFNRQCSVGFIRQSMYYIFYNRLLDCFAPSLVCLLHY